MENVLIAVQQSKEKDNERVLKSKLSLNWSGSLNGLRVDPSEPAPYGKPFVDKLLYLD